MADILYRFIATGQGSVESAFLSIEAAAKRSAKSVEQSARATTRATASRTLDASTGAAEKALKRAADAEVREAKRTADAKIREHDRAANHVAAIRDRHFRDEQRQNERASRLQVRAQERIAAERRRTLTSMGKSVAYTTIGASTDAVAGLAYKAARESMKLQDIAARVSINARGAGEKAIDPTKLRHEFEAAAIANPGVKAEDVAAGTSAYVAKTGDLSAARRYMGTFATASSASGASVESIASMGAELAEKFKITTEEDMRSAIAAVHFGGKAGAFEIADAADKYAKMGSAGARFGLDKGVSGVRTLQGLSQIAMGSTGNRDQAATAMEAMFRQLIAKSTVLHGMGANVFEKGSNSKTRDIREILVDTIKGAHGSTKRLQDIFGDKGITAVSPLISAFNTAKDATKGTEAEKTAEGVKALRAALAKAIDAPGDWAEVVKDSAAAQSTSAAKMDAAWESVKAAAGDKLAPQLAILAGKLAGSPAAFNVFFAGMNAAGDALEAFGALLERLGLIDPDRAGKSSAEGQKAKDASAELAKMSAAEKATPEGQRREAELTTARSMALEKKSILDRAQAKEDEAAAFARNYMGAADPSDLATKEGREQVEMKARALASSLARDPTDTLASSDFLQRLGGENAAQAQLRHGYQTAQATPTWSDGASVGGGASADAAAARMEAAADKFDRAADRLSRQPVASGGSILGASTD